MVRPAYITGTLSQIPATAPIVGNHDNGGIKIARSLSKVAICACTASKRGGRETIGDNGFGAAQQRHRIITR